MNSIQDVLIRLEEIIAENKAQGSTLGYFPALYYAMTAAVRDAIAAGEFEDGPRMERLDLIFAQRYFDAYAAFQAGQPVSAAWNAAFTASNELTVLQYLLLGISAHINLDLGIAAAETAPGPSIFALQKDFIQINAIIARLTEQVQDTLAVICPPFEFLDMALRTKDEGIAEFSITVARETAWNAAVALAFLEGGHRTAFIEELDRGVATFSQRIQQPKGWVIRSALKVIRLAEMGTVGEKIGRLRISDVPQ